MGATIYPNDILCTPHRIPRRHCLHYNKFNSGTCDKTDNELQKEHKQSHRRNPKHRFFLLLNASTSRDYSTRLTKNSSTGTKLEDCSYKTISRPTIFIGMTAGWHKMRK